MTTAQITTFGDLLKCYRVAAGLTQEELAERARVSARGISALERGVNRTPRRETLAVLVEALGLSAPDRGALEAAARRRTSHPVSSPLPTAPRPKAGDRHVGRPPFVGRTHELTLLERHLTSAAPPVLLLVGEPGIGKTRLLQEAAERAREQGLAVLAGGCRRGSQDPYAPLLEALETYVQSQPHAQLRADLEGCAWLVRLLPELAETRLVSLPARALAPEQEYRLMFRAVERFLDNVAGPSGALLALDDLQWAGADALDLLLALARVANQSPLRIVGTYRSTEMGARTPLTSALADLAHAGLAKCVELGPLGLQEAQALLAGLLPEHAAEDSLLAERVLRRAGGVPFFLVSCAQAVRAAAGEARTADAVPWDVAQSIRQRVAALPAPAQDLLGAAAVAGQQSPRAVLLALGALLGLESPTALAALDAACRARLLVEESEDTYQFAHDLIREAIEADLSAARRMALHLQVAEAWEQGLAEPPVELLAYHYSRGGDATNAVLYLERAGERALAMRAHAAAEGSYRELVRWLDELGRSAQAAQAREQLGAVLTTLARYHEALDVLDRAAETYCAADDRGGWGRALARIGSVHALQGTAGEGVARLRPAMETLRTSGLSSLVLADLYVTLAWLVNATGSYGEALADAEQASQLARAAQDTTLLTQAELRRGQVLLMLGRLDEGARALQEAIPLAEAAGDLRSLRFALNSLGWVHEARGEFEQDRQYTERALEVAERLGDPTVIAFMRCHRGGPAFNLGAWGQAREDYERALAMTRQMCASWAAAWPPLMLGQLSLAEGRMAPAIAYLEEAIVLARQNGDLQALRAAYGALAERELLEHHSRAALARLAPLLDRPGAEESDVTKLLPLVAWAHLDRRESGPAAAVLEQCVARATAQKMRPVVVETLRVQAMLAARQGRWEAAEGALGQALALSQAMPSPYAEAKVQYVYGRLHSRRNEPGRARERLAAALAILNRLGERLYATHIEQALAALPERS
jgi:tetratricopeptide (TPR) repeat protein/transcriptional regulator with XRE-family HTH domain